MPLDGASKHIEIGHGDSLVEFSASWKRSSPGSRSHMEGVDSDQRLLWLSLGWLAAAEIVEGEYQEVAMVGETECSVSRVELSRL